MAAAVPLEPEPPRYSDGGSDGGWLCHGRAGLSQLPSLPVSVMTVAANGMPARSASALAPHAAGAGAAAAAFFWVHPTLAHGGAHSNRTTTDARSIGHTLGQASAFSAGAAVWACRYRQYVMGCENSHAVYQAANRLAFGDVKLAFASFLEQIGPEQPFFLAGHSQGSHHVLDLCRERFAPADDGDEA